MNQGSSTRPIQASTSSSPTEELSDLSSLPPSGSSDDEQSFSTPGCHHQTPPDADHTCIHPYHEPYNRLNLPPLLFRLEPPRNPSGHRSELPALMENGVPVRDLDGKLILDFPFLPRYIARRTPGWLLEFWMRTDTRLKHRDIKARMTVPRNELPSDQSLMNSRARAARLPLGLPAWHPKGELSLTEFNMVARLSFDQIFYNTTMRVVYSTSAHPTPIYLVDRSFDPSTGNRFELDIFLDGEPHHEPSPRLKDCMDAIFRVEDFPISDDNSNGSVMDETLEIASNDPQQRDLNNIPSSDQHSMQNSGDNGSIPPDDTHFEDTQESSQETQATRTFLERRRLSEKQEDLSTPDTTAHSSSSGQPSSWVQAPQNQPGASSQDRFERLRTLEELGLHHFLAPEYRTYVSPYK